MSPPKFDDLGKSARDLFQKGYNFGFLKIDTRTKTGTGLEFKTNASHNLATARLHGGVDVKYKLVDYGVTLTEKWSSDNTLGTEILVEDQLAKGLKLTFDTTFAPTLGKRGGKVKTEYAIDQAMFDAVFDVASSTATASTVFSYQGWMAGVQATLDGAQKRLSRHSLAFGYHQPRYQLHTFVQFGASPSVDAADYSAAVYHKAAPNLEISATMGYNSTDQASRFSLGGQYQLDGDTQFRAKVSHTSQLGVAMTHTLRPGVKLILSSLVNLQNFNEGGHKFGLGLEYEQ